MSTNAYYERLLSEDFNTGVASGVERRNPAGGVLTGTQVGLHTFAVGAQGVQALWNPGAVASDESVQTTVSVANASLGDLVLVSLTTMGTSKLTISGAVSSAGTVTVTLHNSEPTTVTVAAGTLTVIVFKIKAS